jgi:hypothetical protein
VKWWEPVFLIAVILASMVVHEQVHVLQFQNLGCQNITTSYFDFKTANYSGITVMGIASTTARCENTPSALEMEIPAYGVQLIFVYVCLCIGAWFIRKQK